MLVLVERELVSLLVDVSGHAIVSRLGIVIMPCIKSHRHVQQMHRAHHVCGDRSCGAGLNTLSSSPNPIMTSSLLRRALPSEHGSCESHKERDVASQLGRELGRGGRPACSVRRMALRRHALHKSIVAGSTAEHCDGARLVVASVQGTVLAVEL